MANKQISFKASETLLGIETWRRCTGHEAIRICFKASETLLGIETQQNVRVLTEDLELQSL